MTVSSAPVFTVSKILMLTFLVSFGGCGSCCDKKDTSLSLYNSYDIQQSTWISYIATPNPTLPFMFTVRPSMNPTQMPTFSPEITFPATEYYALYDIYNEMNGINWRWTLRDNSTMWNFTSPAINNPCIEKWDGISCACTTLNCTVIELALTFHNMTGTIPSTINQLNSLQRLDLSDNTIKGALPGTLMTLYNLQNLILKSNLINSTISSNIKNLKQLEELSIDNNRFHGTLPIELTQLTNLKVLSLAYNFLIGTLPNELSLLIHLNKINLGGNFFIGTILNDIALQLSNLTYFGVSYNYLTGELPLFSYDNNPNLERIDLNTNLFHGTLPVEYGSLLNLKVLDIGHNLLSNSIPNSYQYLIQLYSFDCSNNYLNGTIETILLNKLQLQYFFISMNFFTGKMFPFNETITTVVTTVTVASLTNYWPVLQLFDVYINLLSGSIPLSPISKNIRYIDFGENLLQSIIPNWIADQPLLLSLYMNRNMLTGTIPSILGNNNKLLGTIYLQDNILTGSIPPTIGKIIELRTLQLNSNKFNGTIPNTFQQLEKLTELIIYNNYLTGTIPYFGRSNNYTNNLEIIDISSNLLTGYVPDSLFTISTLQTLIISDNCLQIHFTEKLCSNTSSLLNLIMSGLGTANGCLNRMFPGVPYFTAFTESTPPLGRLPSCLFEMPYLTSLYLSGILIAGTIPSQIVTSNNDNSSSLILKDISLAYNQITGTIPLWLQQTNNYLLLDISNNKLTGILNQNMYEPMDDAFLGFGVNRLSGRIPNLLHEANNISILQGNMFECKSFHEESRGLPEHDPDVHNYSCGSNAINRSIYGWLIMTVIALAVRYYNFYWYSTIVMDANNDHSNPNTFSLNINLIRYHLTRGHNTLMGFMNQAQIIAKELSTMNQDRSSIESMIMLFESVRYVFLCIGLLTVFVIMPIYIALGNWYSMYQYTYAWTISAVFLSGKVSTILLVLCFSCCTILTLWLFYYFVYPLNVTKLKDVLTPQSFSTTNNINNPSKHVNLSCLKIDWIHRIANIIVGVSNFAFILCINIGYVILVLDTSFQTTLLLQLCFSLFKICWNEHVLWKYYPTTKLLIKKIFDKLFNPNDKSMAIRMSWETIDQYKFSIDEIHFMVFTVLLNNIIIPCISIAIVSPHCYYNAFFVQQPTETISLYSCEFYRFRADGGVRKKSLSDCLYYGSDEYETSYNAPFYYRYECSGAFSIKFVSVYVFMFVFVGAISPLLNTLLIWIHYKYCLEMKNEMNTNKEMLTISSVIFRIVDFLLPNRWKTLSSIHEQSGILEIMKQTKLLVNDRLLVKITSYLAILLAFGVVFPPLAVIIVCSIFVITYIEQYSLSRSLVESRILKLDWYCEKLISECQDIAASWYDTLNIILPFISFFYACVVFDTMGDIYGWRAAIVPSLFVFLLPFFFRIVIHTSTKWIGNRNKQAQNDILDVELTGIVEMKYRSTSKRAMVESTDDNVVLNVISVK